MSLSWVSHSTLIYTSELILCSHVGDVACVADANYRRLRLFTMFTGKLPSATQAIDDVDWIGLLFKMPFIPRYLFSL